MEIPFWIPTIAGMLPDTRYRKSLHIVEDVDISSSFLEAKDGDEKLLFSVMYANVRQVQSMMRRTRNHVVMGGYIDPEEFSKFIKES